MTKPPSTDTARYETGTRRRVPVSVGGLFRLLTPPISTRRRVAGMGLGGVLLAGLLLTTAPFIPEASAQTPQPVVINKAGCVANQSRDFEIIDADTDPAEQAKRFQDLEDSNTDIGLFLYYLLPGTKTVTRLDGASVWFFKNPSDVARECGLDVVDKIPDTGRHSRRTRHGMTEAIPWATGWFVEEVPDGADTKSVYIESTGVLIQRYEYRTSPARPTTAIIRSVLSVTGTGLAALPGLPQPSPLLVADPSLFWCQLPGELFDHCDEPVQLLPMWRWTQASVMWSNWGGNFLTSGIRGSIGGMFDMVVRVMYVVAGFLWQGIAWFSHLALTANFIDALAAEMDAVYYKVATALYSSGVIWLVLAVGVVTAAAQILRNGPKAAVSKLGQTLLPISLLLFFLARIANGYTVEFPTTPQQGTTVAPPPAADSFDNRTFVPYDEADDLTLIFGPPQLLHHPKQVVPAGTPRWLFHTVYELSAYPSEAITNASLALMKDDVTHSSYCSRFKTTLEQMFYQTTLDKRVAEGGDATLKASDHSLVALSRIWERAYLDLWAQAQFGSPQSARNGGCLWAENTVPGITPARDDGCMDRPMRQKSRRNASHRRQRNAPVEHRERCNNTALWLRRPRPPARQRATVDSTRTTVALRLRRPSPRVSGVRP